MANSKEKPEHIIKAYTKLTKIESWLFPIAGVLLGSLTAAGSLGISLTSQFFNIILAVIAFGPCLLGSAHCINQYADLELDKINKPWRPLPSGRISVKQALVTGVLLTIIGLAILWFININVFIFGFLFIAILYIYSLPPIRLRKHALLAYSSVGLTFGMLTVLAGWSIFGYISTSVVVLSIIQFFVFFLFIPLKDFEDIKGDDSNNCTSFAISFGPEKAAKMSHLFLSIIPFLYIALVLANFVSIAALYILIPAAIIMAIVPTIMKSDPEAKAWDVAKIYSLLIILCVITVGYWWL